MESPWRSLVLNGITLLASTAIALGIAELAVRIAFRDITTAMPAGNYFFNRWMDREWTGNRWGYRERSFRLEKPIGVRRIAVVGDSLTAGMGVPERKRFTEVMGRILNAGGDRFEVLNFGAPGAEAHHHLLALTGQVLATHPDFVLLQWYVNDFEISKAGSPEPAWHSMANTGLHRALFRSSAFYFLLDHGWRWLHFELGWATPYEQYLSGRFADPAGADSRLAMAQLEGFVSHCARAGVPMGIVLFPLLGERWPAYSLAFLHDRVLGMCSRLGIPCLDLTPAYEPFAGQVEKLWVNRFDHHPSAVAHRLAAERIVSRFAPLFAAP